MKNEFLETIRSLDGEIKNLAYHQRRYESVLATLGETTFEELSHFLNPPKKGLFRCRLVYTVSSIEVSHHEYKKREVNSLKIIHDETIEYSQKSTNRTHLDTLFTQRGDADDVLIVKNGLITDTTIANIALYKDGVWYTPKTPLLHGTTRQRYIDEGVLIERDISVSDLGSFSKTALLNAMVDFDIIANLTYKN